MLITRPSRSSGGCLTRDEKNIIIAAFIMGAFPKYDLERYGNAAAGPKMLRINVRIATSRLK